MSRVTIEKDVCDRCGKDLKWPRTHIMIGKRKKIERLALRHTWGDGYPCDRMIDLCHDCKNDFEEFMENKI